MRRASFAATVLHALVVVLLVSARPASARAQTPPAAPLPREEITAFAKVHLAVGQARDSIQLQLAQPGNKKPETQRQLQDKLRAQIAEILHHAGMTEQEFDRKTYLVSTDADARQTFDAVVAQLTGQPAPGQVLATAPARAAVPAATATIRVPAGPAGVHIGHVVNAFSDTPNG
ncbi:MAG: DUF4168 domain-containing protein, partial [Gemmatimonas sp.]